MLGGRYVKSSDDVEKVIYNSYPEVANVLCGLPLLRFDLVGLHIVVIGGQEDVKGFPSPRSVDGVQAVLDKFTGRGPPVPAHPAIFPNFFLLAVKLTEKVFFHSELFVASVTFKIVTVSF